MRVVAIVHVMKGTEIFTNQNDHPGQGARMSLFIVEGQKYYYNALKASNYLSRQ
jgi:hypothetical protein